MNEVEYTVNQEATEQEAVETVEVVTEPVEKEKKPSKRSKKQETVEDSVVPTIVELPCKLVREGAIAPTYATDGSAALDFYAAENVTVWDERVYCIGLGVAVEVPKGYALQLIPRSSIGKETPLRMPNSMGLIDPDYRGEIKAMYVNDETRGMVPYLIAEGERIAQGYLVPTPTVKVQIVEELSETNRGEGGFGSTGK